MQARTRKPPPPKVTLERGPPPTQHCKPATLTPMPAVVSQPKLDGDPELWKTTPWRSAHDGMNTSMDSRWKWNDPKPKEMTREYTHYDQTLKRNKKAVIPLSDYGENFKDHGIYKPQTPTNMVAIPNLPFWQRPDGGAISQMRPFRKKKCGYRKPWTLLQWCTLASRNNGMGASM